VECRKHRIVKQTQGVVVIVVVVVVAVAVAVAVGSIWIIKD